MCIRDSAHFKFQHEKYRLSQIDVYTLRNVISQKRNETEIQIVLCSVP